MPWQRGTAEITAPSTPYCPRKEGSSTAVPSAQNQMPLAGSLPAWRRRSVTGWWSSTRLARRIRSAKTAARSFPWGRYGPAVSPRWS